MLHQMPFLFFPPWNRIDTIVRYRRQHKCTP